MELGWGHHARRFGSETEIEQGGIFMQSRRPLRPSIWVHGLSDSSWAPSFFIIVFGLLQMRQNSNEILSSLRVNHQGRFHLGQAVYVDEKKILTKNFFFYLFLYFLAFCSSRRDNAGVPVLYSSLLHFASSPLDLICFILRELAS